MEIRQKRRYGEAMKAPRKTVELHPSEWNRNWRPPIGNDPRPGQKPHIWQEFKRDLNMRREAGEPVVGAGWPTLAGVFIGFLIALYFRLDGGPEWLLAVRNLF